MTSVAWKIVRTMVEPAVVTSLAVTVLTSGVAVWTTVTIHRRVSSIARDVAGMRADFRSALLPDETTCRQAAAEWLAESEHVLRSLINLEDKQDGVD